MLLLNLRFEIFPRKHESGLRHVLREKKMFRCFKLQTAWEKQKVKIPTRTSSRVVSRKTCRVSRFPRVIRIRPNAYSCTPCLPDSVSVKSKNTHRGAVRTGSEIIRHAPLVGEPSPSDADVSGKPRRVGTVQCT